MIGDLQTEKRVCRAVNPNLLAVHGNDGIRDILHIHTSCYFAEQNDRVLNGTDENSPFRLFAIV